MKFTVALLAVVAAIVPAIASPVAEPEAQPAGELNKRDDTIYVCSGTFVPLPHLYPISTITHTLITVQELEWRLCYLLPPLQ